MQLQDFGRYTWYKERKLKQWLKGNWPDSAMLASNEGPSRRSTLIFFEELSRLAEELQNIIPEDTITYKERIREALHGLQYLKVTNCESRQHLEPLENLLNVFYQDLSRQSESSDPRVAVFRRTVSTLTHSGPGRPKYEIP